MSNKKPGRPIPTLSPREVVDAIDELIKIRAEQAAIRQSASNAEWVLSLGQHADAIEMAKRKITDGIIQYSGVPGVYKT